MGDIPEGRRLARVFGLVLAAVLVIGAIGTAEAARGDRTLKLYFGHTGERGEFTFKRNGRYDQGELKRLNVFLRDWRKKEPTQMDPRLFDLVWAIYQETGSNDYIHVVSAYRSPETNAKLRSRSSGVAKKSQHMLGKAMDFYIPGVPLDKLRATAMKFQVGGVGYYPTSGSPFIHADVGSVRAWPRMTRQQLVRIFPDGETLHLPADGKPLSGYQQALAKYGNPSKDYQLAMIDRSLGGGSGRRGSSGIAVAQADKKTVGDWLKRVFSDSGDEDEEGGIAPAAPAAMPAPAPVMVAAVVPPPLPMPRPAGDAPIVADSAGSAIALLAGSDAAVGTELAYAPMPRSRPVGPDLPGARPALPQEIQTAAVEIPASESLVDLAARMEIDQPAAQTLSADDVARLAQIAAAAPQPAARLAYADNAAPADSAVAALATAAYEKDDTSILARIASAHSFAEPQFAALAEPQPDKVPELFAIPKDADAVEQSHGRRVLTADNASGQNTARAGFFGKLLSDLF